jgi:LmbE family N-acetylglucosaminyl deacetylase
VIRATRARNACAASSSRATRRSLLSVLALLILGGAPAAGQLVPPSTGGAPELDRLLQQIGSSGRILVIGAHPDDEDTNLLTLLSRGQGVEAAYLSLTRGDGGQNLIGPELGIGLGMLRSRELEAARAIDGARQFVTRAFDFGFTRSYEETAGRWMPDSILKDAVRVVRRFRPQVIVSVFSGTPADGHGQHQMAGRIARDAFAVASDPRRFPELQSEEGLEPWQPLKLYQSTRFRPDPSSLVLELGGLDPRDGRSYYQIAQASRSRHSSQDMGRLQPIGPERTTVALLEDRTGDGAEGLLAGIPRDSSTLEATADSLRRVTSAPMLAGAAPALNAALRRWRESGGNARHQRLLERAAATAAGVVVDATADAEHVLPGRTVTVTLQVYNAGPYAVDVDRLGVEVPSGWSAPVDTTPISLPPGGEAERILTVTVPDGAEPTEPYFLARPLVGDMYDWDAADPAVRGELFGPPLLQGEAVVRIDRGPDVRLRREVTYRYNDQAIGEVRRPITVVPRVGVRLDPEMLVWSTESDVARSFTVTLTHFGDAPVSGSVLLAIDAWGVERRAPFAFERRGQTQTVTLTVRRPATARDGFVPVRAAAVTDDGESFDRTVEQIEYAHVRPTQWTRAASGTVRVAPIALPRVGSVGYVRGASDRVPEALAAIGVPVHLLSEDDLASGDLGRYDVVVVGPRAYEIDSALVRHNDRLLAYAREGGHLVVQYQQFQFSRGEFAPYPLEIARPTSRVTDETAPVEVLAPSHPVFHRPNRIEASDWDGWVQERGLYFAGPWDEQYTPLLEMADPGEPPARGSLLVARYGRGSYVYTGVSFFRSIPAGIPGAYRLFLNLLAWGG